MANVYDHCLWSLFCGNSKVHQYKCSFWWSLFMITAGSTRTDVAFEQMVFAICNAKGLKANSLTNAEPFNRHNASMCNVFLPHSWSSKPGLEHNNRHNNRHKQKYTYMRQKAGNMSLEQENTSWVFWPGLEPSISRKPVTLHQRKFCKAFYSMEWRWSRHFLVKGGQKHPRYAVICVQYGMMRAHCRSKFNVH